MYFDFAMKRWIGPSGVCEVQNNIELAVDDFVDCSCKHLTHYAVKASTTDTGLVGYPVWFYIACFVCMVSIQQLE